ncbi:VirB4 family type IV secretion/conjugal transfer ATPase (plasmid) [Acidovorax sp. 210-6]|nr:VirB4 family type IV secretion/conjugal transfer ATPase [Acidovorax sp. 210-6]
MRGNLKFAAALDKEVGVSAFLPYAGHITQNIIAMINGDMMFTVRLSGAAHQSADIADLNGWHNQLNGYIRNISSPHVAIWSHIVRRAVFEYPDGSYPNGFVNSVNDKYRSRIEDTTLMVNELYISVVFRPNPVSITKVVNMFSRPSKKELMERQHEGIEMMEDLIATTVTALDRYDPTLLGCYEHKGNHFSETCEFLNYILNGMWQRFPLPRAELRDTLPTSRPFFGKGGLMSLRTPTNDYFCAALAFQEYPSQTTTGMLDDLLSVPFEFTLGQSFTFLSKPAARGRMTRQQKRLINAGDVATSQVEAINDALDDLTSNVFVMGTHSLALMIKAPDEKSLNGYVSLAGSILSDAGIKWSREDLGMAAAYYSLMPGNFDYRVRAGDITSRNFCAFSCLHNFPIGRLNGNQWGPAVTIFKTTSGTPYYFSFHKSEDGADAKKAAKLDPNHKELANTVVLGKSGTGKTVIEGFLLAQVQKFNKPPQKRLTSIVFDKDLGAAVAVRAMGGKYYPLKNGVPTGFNPFQLDPTPNNITFLENLVRYLVKREGMPISPRDEAEIAKAIAGVMNPQVPRSQRRLSAIMQFLNPTEQNGIHMRLARWCHGIGPLGWALDNVEDTMNIDENPIIGFDVTEFLENAETRTPIIMYLMHRIQSLFDGRRVIIFMDEFWKLLDDPEFEDFVKNKLVTIRKQDGFLVCFTQAPKQVIRSPIAFAIIEQTATKIFLPNPEADREDYIKHFKLSEKEYELIRDLPEKSRRFLIKQGANSVVAELDLRGFDDELAVLSGNTATSILAEQLVSQLGEDPDIWLPEFHKIRKERTTS